MTSDPTDPPAEGANVVPLRAVDAETEVRLDEDKPPGPSYVDLTGGDAQRRPLIPGPLADAGGGEASRQPGRGPAWPPRRVPRPALPGYSAKALGFAVWGVVVTDQAPDRLVAHPRYDQLEWEAAANGLLNDHLRIHKQGRETRKARGTILALCLAGLAAAAVAMVVFAPWWGVGARRGRAVRAVRPGRAPGGQDDHDAGPSCPRRSSRRTRT